VNSGAVHLCQLSDRRLISSLKPGNKQPILGPVHGVPPLSSRTPT